jgi:nitric oxide synthase oxygenase domain/subunit
MMPILSMTCLLPVRDAGVKVVLYLVVQDALQEPIEAEETARLGAGRWEWLVPVVGPVSMGVRVVFVVLRMWSG